MIKNRRPASRRRPGKRRSPMLNKFINVILYMGLEKEQYRTIRREIDSSNRSNVVVFSAIGAVFFLALTVAAALPGSTMRPNIGIYGFAAVLMCLTFAVNRFLGSRSEMIIWFSVLFFILVLLGLGIYLAVVVSPDERTTTYLGLLMAVSCVFCIGPLNYAFVICAVNLTLGIMLKRVQTGDLLRENLINIAIFGLASIVVAAYLMHIKASKFWGDHLNEHLIEVDQLTGLYNRRSYEHRLDVLRCEKKTAGIIMLDVNQLKKINDTLGHKAGDELICGASACIRQVFSKYGTCYRIGGDEFAVILNSLYEPLPVITEEFDKIIYGWRGQTLNLLSVSYGIATPEEYPDLSQDELIQKADKLMYAAKAAYYRKAGIDRRAR